MILVILACLPVALPKLVGIQSFNVISGSMEPSISVGSIVYVKSVDASEIQKDDVIAFESGASVVTHRVVGILEDGSFTTKGDANKVEDFKPVHFKDVIGKVEFHMPVFGYIAAWISEITGKIVAVMVLIVGLILSNAGEKKSSDKDEQVKSQGKINPKAILALGLVIVIGSTFGFLYIFMGYQKSNNLYNNVASKYSTTSSSQNWEDMINVDVAALQKINPEVVGWIYVEGTDISYPIMYSGDDDKYLHSTLVGEYAKAGSIFLEGYNLPDFSDSHNIIYGHNMRNLSMFGSLKFYKSEENYLNDHKYFQVITADSKMRFEIFSYFDTEAASWVYAVPYSDSELFQDYISELKRHSYKNIDSKEVTSSDKVVTLSTCSSSGRRFTVHGVMVNSKTL